MPLYGYECLSCGHKFKKSQKMKDKPLDKCPEWGGEVKRIIRGGMGFLVSGKDFQKNSRRNNPRGKN